MSSAAAPFLSYSANNEDVILNRLFSERGEGFFVDVGAAHPFFENDTWALYDRGWHGINIEPNASFYQLLVEQRPRDINLNLVVSDEPGEVTFHEVVGTGLSTCNPDDAKRAEAKGFEVVRHIVRAMTLRDILANASASVIDVLKVDVEGFELKVMASNDWSRFRPRIILAEGTYPESPVRRQDGVAAYLASQGYRHVYFDGLNDFYAEQDFTPAPDVFDRPPNVFDHFVPFALATQIESLRQERESLMQERENARRYTNSLVVDLENARAELIAMRERGKALAAELEAMAMRQLLGDRETDRLSREIAGVYASNSWRVTRPLRALARPRRTLRILMGQRPE